MSYKIVIMPEAAKDFQRLAKSEPKAFAKANSMLKELESHPKSGTGHPEPLKGFPGGRWSRKITKKHRLIYRIFDEKFMLKF